MKMGVSFKYTAVVSIAAGRAAMALPSSMQVFDCSYMRPLLRGLLVLQEIRLLTVSFSGPRSHASGRLLSLCALSFSLQFSLRRLRDRPTPPSLLRQPNRLGPKLQRVIMQ